MATQLIHHHYDAPRRSGPQAVVGWVHHPLPKGIELEVQTTPSAQALDNQQIATTRLVLSRNQALLLASFLLNATGYSEADVPKRSVSRWPRWFSRRS
jgi:hypothetical protein